MPEFIHLHGVFGHGLCQCGCGQVTRKADRTSRDRGWVKGQSLRFINGHRKWSPDYEEIDMGFDTCCWVWLKAVDLKGYGLKHDPERKGTRRAHIFYYEKEHGPIPNELELDHLCRVRKCCRPIHLEPVTHVENVHRGRAHVANQKIIDGVIHGRIPGETQYELAKRHGISQTTVSRILRGTVQYV